MSVEESNARVAASMAAKEYEVIVVFRVYAENAEAARTATENNLPRLAGISIEDVRKVQ